MCYNADVGYYSEYLDKKLDLAALGKERKKQLAAISTLRGNRDVLVFAADMNKQMGPLISINYSDLLPFQDQLSNLKGKQIDLILETPGGSGEVAEDMVRLLRDKYEEVGVIVPGYAKSAGTIIAMSADEILMSEKISSLGPIDAQLISQGKIFSAGAFLEGINKIKEEVNSSGVLNKSYIPILQGISPGEIQNATNALEFATSLVEKWLEKYKFKNWTTHSTTGKPVTDEEKKNRAHEIAKKLCDHQHWLTHGRSIKLSDFEEMGLKIVDYSKTPALAEAIDRYYTLLEMSFASSPMYKLFETKDTQISRFGGVAVPPKVNQMATNAPTATINFTCNKCSTIHKIQVSFDKLSPVQGGAIAFPADGKFKCTTCGTEHDLNPIKVQVEAQTQRKIVTA